MNQFGLDRYNVRVLGLVFLWGNPSPVEMIYNSGDTPLHEKFRVQKCKVSDIFDLTIDIEVIRLGYGVYYRVDDSLKMQDPCVFILSSSPLTALEPSP